MNEEVQQRQMAGIDKPVGVIRNVRPVVHGLTLAGIRQFVRDTEKWPEATEVDCFTPDDKGRATRAIPMGLMASTWHPEGAAG